MRPDLRPDLFVSKADYDELQGRLDHAQLVAQQWAKRHQKLQLAIKRLVKAKGEWVDAVHTLQALDKEVGTVV